MITAARFWVGLNVVVVVDLVKAVVVVDLVEGWPNALLIQVSCVVIFFQAVHDRLLDVVVFIRVVEGVLEDGVDVT